MSELISTPELIIDKEKVSLNCSFNFGVIFIKYRGRLFIEQLISSDYVIKKKNDKIGIFSFRKPHYSKVDLFKYNGRCRIVKCEVFGSDTEKIISNRSGRLRKSRVRRLATIKGTDVDAWSRLGYKKDTPTWDKMRTYYSGYDWNGRNDMIKVPVLENQQYDYHATKVPDNRYTEKTILKPNPATKVDKIFPYIGNLRSYSGIIDKNGENYQGSFYMVKKNKSLYKGKEPSKDVKKTKVYIKSKTNLYKSNTTKGGY